MVFYVLLIKVWRYEIAIFKNGLKVNGAEDFLPFLLHACPVSFNDILSTLKSLHRSCFHICQTAIFHLESQIFFWYIGERPLSDWNKDQLIEAKFCNGVFLSNTYVLCASHQTFIETPLYWNSAGLDAMLSGGLIKTPLICVRCSCILDLHRCNLPELAVLNVVTHHK